MFFRNDSLSFAPVDMLQVEGKTRLSGAGSYDSFTRMLFLHALLKTMDNAVSLAKSQWEMNVKHLNNDAQITYSGRGE